jgi:hypothetical protein
MGPLPMLAAFVASGATHLPLPEMLWSVGAASMGTVPLVVLVRAALGDPTCG